MASPMEEVETTEIPTKKRIKKIPDSVNYRVFLLKWENNLRSRYWL